MIKRFTQVLCLLTGLLSASAVIAQPTLQATNFPNSGDIWAYKTITDTTIQPGLTGSGITWNYSSYFVNPTVFNQQFSTPGSSPDDALFPTSNLKVTSSFGGSEYYIRNASELQFLGYKSVTGDLRITNAQNCLTVPLSFGQSVTNAAVTGTAFSGFNVTGTISATADGKGTVQLQTGTFNNVLRVFYDFNLVAGADFGLDTYIHLKRYCWYRTGQRAPVLIIESLSITGALANSYQKSVLVNTVTTTGLEDLSSSINFYVSPNPIRDKATVTVGTDRISTLAYSIMDITGRVWRKEEAFLDANRSFTTDLSGLPKGIYILSLLSDGARRQQRIVVE